MIALFGGKKSHEQAEVAAKADLDAATKALEAAKVAKASALETLGAEVEALSARFEEAGDPAIARELSTARSTLAEVEAWHLGTIEKLTAARNEAEERHRVASGTATAARLLAGAVTRAKEFGVINKRLESLAAAVRKGPLAELRGESMPALSDPFVRAELVRLLPEVLGEGSDLAALVRAGIQAYGDDAAGLEKALNVPAAELFDARQFEAYGMTGQLLGDLLAAISGADEDLKKRGAADEKAEIQRERERLKIEEDQRAANERAAIAASLMPGLDRLAEVAEPYIGHLTPESALRAVGGFGVNPTFAHAERDRLMAARRAAPPDGKPMPLHPSDQAWAVILARRNLLWSKTLSQKVGEDTRIIDNPISVEAAMDRLIDRELKERRRAAA